MHSAIARVLAPVLVAPVFLAPVLLAYLLLAPALLGAAPPAEAEVGEPAPAFTLRTLDGKEWSLASARGSAGSLLGELAVEHRQDLL